VGDLEYKLNLLTESYAELENHNIQLQNFINSNGNAKGNAKIPPAPQAPTTELLGATRETRKSAMREGERSSSTHSELDQKIARAANFSSSAPAPSSSAATALASIQPSRPVSSQSNRNVESIGGKTRSSSSSPTRVREQQQQLATQYVFRSVSPQNQELVQSVKDGSAKNDGTDRVTSISFKESEQRNSPNLNEDSQISREDSFSTTSQSSVTAGGTKVKRKSLFKSVGKFILGKTKEKKSQPSDLVGST
jgi:hypothetical protein